MAFLNWWIFDEPFRFLGDDEEGKLLFVTPDRSPEMRFATEPGAAIASFTLTDQLGNVLGPFAPAANAYNFATGLTPGRYKVTMTGTDANGRPVTAQSTIRIVASVAYGSRLNVANGTRAGVAYGTAAR